MARTRDFLISIALSLGFIVLAAWSLDWARIAQVLGRADPRLALPAVPVMWLAIALRGQRLAGFLGQPARRLFRIAILHNAWNTILPFKMGEAALPVLLGRHLGVSLPGSLAYLTAIRLCDLVALLLTGLGVAGVLLAGGRLAVQPGRTLLALAIGAGVLGLACVLLIRLARRAQRLEGSTRLRAGASHYASSVLAIGRPAYLRGIRTTALIWGCLALIAYLATIAVNPERSAGAAFVGFGGAALSVVLPISGIANVGTFQASWVALQLVYGVPLEEAVSASVLSHAVMLTGTLSLAALAWVIPEPARTAT